MWPFVFARAGVFGGFFLLEPACVGACLSQLEEGPPLGSREADTQSERVSVLAAVLGKQGPFIVLVTTTPTSSEESAPVTFFSRL